MSLVYEYLCGMRDEITIPVLKVEDLVTATERRGKYSLVRDLQAKEFNEAIASRMARSTKQVKCEKCGKEFSVGIGTEGSLTCPEC
jgi:hypothetical protein